MGRTLTEDMYPAATPELASRRKELAPEINEAFEHFSRAVFADGALPEKTKQLIAVAVAHVTQCRTASEGTPSSLTAKGHGPRRSWRRSGSRPRCGPAAHTPIRHSPCTPWAR
jgi:Carboxymuconolactone decarboxylase family